jgi:hypothetical protein
MAGGVAALDAHHAVPVAVIRLSRHLADKRFEYLPLVVREVLGGCILPSDQRTTYLRDGL